MSVLLTAGKKAAKKLKEQERAKLVQRAAQSSISAPLNYQKATKLIVLANVPHNSYMPSENTVVWNVELDSTQYSIALRKDNMTVWCNDSRLNVEHNFEEDGSVIDFEVAAHKARIKITGPAGAVSGHQRSYTDEARPVQNTFSSFSSLSQHLMTAPRGSMERASSPVPVQHKMSYELIVDGDLMPQTALIKM